MKKDYYEVLGLSKGATDDQIKQAYRKLARENHPDVAKDKSGAEAKFKEINEAYQVLGDAQKKAAYDQYGHASTQGFGGGAGGPGGFGGFGGQWGPFSYSTSGGQGAGAGFSGFDDIDPFDVFESFFGFRGNRAPKRGKNLQYEMRLEFVDAVKGLEKTIKVESGEVTIKIPAGISDGNQMKFTGKGMAGPNGLPAGDLFITFYVNLPKNFERSGDVLGTSAEIDFVTAILGGNIDVTVVDPDSRDGLGKATLKIPNGTQSGTRFRLKEKGMPIVNNRHRGDVIVMVTVDIPNKISKQQKEMLEKYKSL